MNRRRFLYWAGGGCTLAGFLLATRRSEDLNPSHDEQPRAGQDPPPLKTVARTSWALGSMVRMTVLHPQEREAHRALDAAFAELERIEACLSLYRADSQVSRLNRDQVLADPDPDLVQLLGAAQEMSERTQGAFDITVQPLWDLYARAKQAGRLPARGEVKEARARVDWRRVHCSANLVRLVGQGTCITLNGLAQGFAADRVIDTLRKHGVEHALIDTGEIGALGARSRDDDWTVGIQHPRESDAYLSLTRLTDRCLATSGDYATTFSSDHRHHHLFDPRTGDSPAELASVSVAALTALAADALSTAIFVLGLSEGLALVRETPEADAMLVTKSGRTVTTAGFPVV